MKIRVEKLHTGKVGQHGETGLDNTSNINVLFPLKSAKNDEKVNSCHKRVCKHSEMKTAIIIKMIVPIIFLGEEFPQHYLPHN